jgi:hypothetical protein
MSTATDYFRAILNGGLPAALDLGMKAGAKQGDTKPETVAPSATIKDRDTGKPTEVSVFSYITAKEIVIGVAGLIVVGAVLYVALRAAKAI